jgi:oxaloacetate decarboxylase alpha subunit
VRNQGKHAQGTLSYTISPVHTIDSWLALARQIEDMGADSLSIKDMAGLLRPYTAFELVSRLKETVQIPIHMQCHATTGLSTPTYLKAIEAGIDNIDTAISSMSMTYGHSPTETVVSILHEQPGDTGLDIVLLEEIASYFREVRKKYAKFEGALRGVDSRILVAQVPGGMLTNLENQLREQNASERLDEVLDEIPHVRKDLGYIPLVTPTSQIVGTQAVLNVLTGQRYKSVTKETEGVLKGEYGATSAEVNSELQEKVLKGAEPISCRPADLLDDEFIAQRTELQRVAAEEGFELESVEDDTLTYALFPQVGLKFLKNRNNPEIFEPAPGVEPVAIEGHSSAQGVYAVEMNGGRYEVRVSNGGELSSITETHAAASAIQAATVNVSHALSAPLAGDVYRVEVAVGDNVVEGDVIAVLDAMKMETEIRATAAGKVIDVAVKAGDSINVGQTLVTLG